MKLDTRWMLTLMALTIALSGCDKMQGLSDSAQAVTKRQIDDNEKAWGDLFTYHPKQPNPLPQTRYCYKLQSDVVCYDSEQPTLTAKLVGYQDGDKQSWIQPGGGSLGASGGAPVSYRSQGVGAAEHRAAPNDYDIVTGPVSGQVGSGPANSVISVNSLPPIQPRTLGSN
jgi:hypothetical protein